MIRGENVQETHGKQTAGAEGSHGKESGLSNSISQVQPINNGLHVTYV
jgi:hypothetical protein